MRLLKGFSSAELSSAITYFCQGPEMCTPEKKSCPLYIIAAVVNYLTPRVKYHTISCVNITKYSRIPHVVLKKDFYMNANFLGEK